MPVSAARAAAFDILIRVERQGAYASELLHSVQFRTLSAADHGLATQLTMGVLRWQSALDATLASVSSQNLNRLDPEVLIALRLGLFQMRYLERIPARAAIFESVELAKRARKSSAAPFVNALLRKAQKLSALSNENDPYDATTLSVATAHPFWLVERWIKHFGFDHTRAICNFNQTIPTTAIHLYDPDAEAELLRAGIALNPGALLRDARQVVHGDVTTTSAFASGRVVIQDEASQLVALLVGTGRKILDCCAAPGGKTRLIANRNPESELVAVDLHPHRASLLRRLAGAGNVSIVAADARHLPVIERFDRILADVPCSGTGTLAHNPEIKWRLTTEDLTQLSARQFEILEAAFDRVTSGGRVLYSTCSLEPEENELVVERLLAKFGTAQLVDCRDELRTLQKVGDVVIEDTDSLITGKYLRTISGVHRCEGFFAAILQKN